MACTAEVSERGKAWTDAEWATVRALRSQVPPVPYGVIARNLGRTFKSVREKWDYERRVPSPGVSGQPASTVERGSDDQMFVRRLLAAGGFSRPITVKRVGPGAGDMPVIFTVLLGPDGRPRPCASPACRCIASQETECPVRRKARRR